MDVEERKTLRIDAHEELSSLLVFGTTSNDIISNKAGLPLELIHTLRELYFSTSTPLNQEVEGFFSALKRFLMTSPIHVRPDNAQLVIFQEKSNRLLDSLRSTIERFQRANTVKITALKNFYQSLFDFALDRIHDGGQSR